MVIGGEPGIGEAVGLGLAQHAERDAGLHVERAHPAHHGKHAVEGRTVLHLAPGRAHAEARGAGLSRDPRLGQHVVDVEQGLAAEPGLLGVMGRLRAIFAVLGAGAGLDRKQARELDLAVFMVAPVHCSRLIDQFEQREREQVDDLPARPIVAKLMGRFRLAQALRPLGLAVDRIHGFEDV